MHFCGCASRVNKWTINFILCAVLYNLVLSHLGTLTVPLCVWVYLCACACVYLKRTYSEDIQSSRMAERVDERVCTIGSRVALASKRVYLFISDTIKCQVIKEKSLPYQFLSSQSTTRYNKWQDILSLFLSLSLSLFGIFH